jgi:hypothetical protein
MSRHAINADDFFALDFLLVDAIMKDYFCRMALEKYRVYIAHARNCGFAALANVAGQILFAPAEENLPSATYESE